MFAIWLMLINLLILDRLFIDAHLISKVNMVQSIDFPVLSEKIGKTMDRVF